LIESAQLKKHRQGDLCYFSLPVHDIARAQSFFGAVLGWQFADPQQGHVTNVSAPPGGVAPIEGQGSTSPQLWFVVDDIHAAVAKTPRTRWASGRAGSVRLGRVRRRSRLGVQPQCSGGEVLL
jgi:hypothetical protein